MNTKQILSELRSQRDRLNQAIAALESISSNGAVPSSKAQSRPAKKRRMSAAARKRLSELMKKRWASGKMKKGKAKVA
jgi:hypothetical protein